MTANPLTLWLTVIAIGLITFVYRLSFVFWGEWLTLPPGLQRPLRFVPIAALTAIIMPELLLRNGVVDFTSGNVRLLAGLLAVVIAWRTRNVLLTILCGMVALWVLQWLVG